METAFSGFFFLGIRLHDLMFCFGAGNNNMNPIPKRKRYKMTSKGSLVRSFPVQLIFLLPDPWQESE